MQVKYSYGTNFSLISGLSEECLIEILKCLSPKDLVIVSLVSRFFKCLADDNLLWRRHFKNDFPTKYCTVTSSASPDWKAAYVLNFLRKILTACPKKIKLQGEASHILLGNRDQLGLMNEEEFSCLNVNDTPSMVLKRNLYWNFDSKYVAQTKINDLWILATLGSAYGEKHFSIIGLSNGEFKTFFNSSQKNTIERVNETFGVYFKEITSIKLSGHNQTFGCLLSVSKDYSNSTGSGSHTIYLFSPTDHSDQSNAFVCAHSFPESKFNAEAIHFQIHERLMAVWMNSDCVNKSYLKIKEADDSISFENLIFEFDKHLSILEKRPYPLKEKSTKAIIIDDYGFQLKETIDLMKKFKREVIVNPSFSLIIQKLPFLSFMNTLVADLKQLTDNLEKQQEFNARAMAFRAQLDLMCKHISRWVYAHSIMLFKIDKNKESTCELVPDATSLIDLSSLPAPISALTLSNNAIIASFSNGLLSECNVQTKCWERSNEININFEVLKVCKTFVVGESKGVIYFIHRYSLAILTKISHNVPVIWSYFDRVFVRLEKGKREAFIHHFCLPEASIDPLRPQQVSTS